MIEAQKLARRFNKDEAIWRTYEHKRALRRLLGSRPPLPEDIWDYLDWQVAERECRAVPSDFSTHEDYEIKEAD